MKLMYGVRTGQQEVNDWRGGGAYGNVWHAGTIFLLKLQAGYTIILRIHYNSIVNSLIICTIF